MKLIYIMYNIEIVEEDILIDGIIVENKKDIKKIYDQEAFYYVSNDPIVLYKPNHNYMLRNQREIFQDLIILSDKGYRVMIQMPNDIKKYQLFNKYTLGYERFRRYDV